MRFNPSCLHRAMQRHFGPLVCLARSSPHWYTLLQQLQMLTSRAESLLQLCRIAASHPGTGTRTLKGAYVSKGQNAWAGQVVWYSLTTNLLKCSYFSWSGFEPGNSDVPLLWISSISALLLRARRRQTLLSLFTNISCLKYIFFL